ncbi:unnamed protein product [Gongylonema pulchrum]|uniref:TRAF-type domain-containing protein n=1 Tax=Gongylonema pulchrum TaxID=637853 RepID=A0A183E7I0_9BILA|nr:unnamed protein product [Gongylonema pulchrum]
MDSSPEERPTHSTINSIHIDDHIHCIYCFRTRCTYSQCELRPCPECRAVLHTCKLEDHLTICPKVFTFSDAFVPCLCQAYGCPLWLRRYKIKQHLEHCCASAVFCAVQWNRRILSNYAKPKIEVMRTVIPNIVNYKMNHTYMCFQIIFDFQEEIIDSYRISREDRKLLTDFQNPCHPMMPLRLSFERQPFFEDEDSSDEENRQKEIQLKQKRSPFEHCYLCKADPASQHLHVLGNASFEKDIAADEEKQAPVKVSPLPPFYESRNLYVNIVRDRLSAFFRKGENMPCVRSGISVYTYCCNESFRRDEYCAHYELSHMNIDDCIGRCPLYLDGCPFFFCRSEPLWGQLRYIVLLCFQFDLQWA